MGEHYTEAESWSITPRGGDHLLYNCGKDELGEMTTWMAKIKNTKA